MKKRRANNQAASSFIAKAKAARACVLNKVQGSFHSKTQKCSQNKNGVFSHFHTKNVSAPNTSNAPASLAHGASFAAAPNTSATTKQEKLHRLMPIASAMLVALCIGLLLAVLFAKYTWGTNVLDDGTRVADFNVETKGLTASKILEIDRTTTYASYQLSVTNMPNSTNNEVITTYSVELEFPQAIPGYYVIFKNGDKTISGTWEDDAKTKLQFGNIGTFEIGEKRTDTLTLTIGVYNPDDEEALTLENINLKLEVAQVD